MRGKSCPCSMSIPTEESTTNPPGSNEDRGKLGQRHLNLAIPPFNHTLDFTRRGRDCRHAVSTHPLEQILGDRIPRDSSVQPKVATKALPWVQIKNFHNPNAGCVIISPIRRTRARTQLLQRCDLFLTATQRSPMLALTTQASAASV